MVHVSDIKLIRTDTTLDLSQKAEKAIVMDSSPQKINLISCEPMVHVSDIKLIRTDTTLDLSQKAEKGMICTTVVTAYILVTCTSALLTGRGICTCDEELNCIFFSSLQPDRKQWRFAHLLNNSGNRFHTKINLNFMDLQMNIDNTEDYIKIQLDNHPNELIEMQLALTIKHYGRFHLRKAIAMVIRPVEGGETSRSIRSKNL
ncbi:hypothetical protein VNO77_01048 [Canavalia gladiata]|uniref:Uncharacterized protein n=1 Tax=Canavalia gladiata TaxID=3824 RepID=A0AAN9R4M1_CANGL